MAPFFIHLFNTHHALYGIAGGAFFLHSHNLSWNIFSVSVGNPIYTDTACMRQSAK